MQDFRNLAVWKKAHKLTLKIYEVTALFPNSEMYGLSSQMRRSASSVPTNLAEGCGRDGNAELRRFTNIALGSASELHYQLILAHDLSYLSAEHFAEYETDVIEVKRMLVGFLKSLNP